jgi:hypothetical protein
LPEDLLFFWRSSLGESGRGKKQADDGSHMSRDIIRVARAQRAGVPAQAGEVARVRDAPGFPGVSTLAARELNITVRCWLRSGVSLPFPNSRASSKPL